MEEIKDIYKNVCQVIESSIGISKDEINLDDTLFDDLGVDSIDLVDILFELESLYEIELKVTDIEAKAKEELGNIPYEINGTITADGLEVLKKHLSEIEPNKLKEGMTIHELVKLFNVHSLCKIVQYRIETAEND